MSSAKAKKSSSSSSSSSSPAPVCQLYCGSRSMSAACCGTQRGSAAAAAAGAGAGAGAAAAHFVCAPCLLQWLRTNAKPSCPVCLQALSGAGLDEVVRASRRGKAKAGALRPVGADEEARWRAGGRAPPPSGAARSDPRTRRRLAREFKAEGSKACPRCEEAVTHYRDGSCHSVTCPGCEANFCFVCSLESADDGEACANGCVPFCNPKCDCIADPDGDGGGDDDDDDE